MAEIKTVAERLREAEGLCEIHGMCRVVLCAINGEATCPSIASCVDCKIGILRTLARQIEAEQTELAKRIEVLESDRDDYLEHVTTFACWQMQIANMLNIPLAEINNSEEVHSKIIAALKDANASKPMPLPEGVIWPRFEDGELVKFGDKLGREIVSIEFYGDFVTMRAKDGTNIQTDIYGTRYERPEPEVLDADNVPIKVGDTVYASNAEPLTVRELTSEDLVLIEDSNGELWELRNYALTHRTPDTQEAIDADCWVDAKDYCEKYGVKTEWPKHYGKAKCEHLLERQRKLMGGE